MDVKVVIGANYGDEGKGSVVNFLTKPNTIVVLTNGGSQRGHTVVTDDGRTHVFHHFGSGTLKGADTYYSKEFILNPMTYVMERNQLKDYNFKTFRDSRCRWTTPYDILVNQLQQRAEGHNHTCGQGIWETVIRSDKHSCVPFGYFLSWDRKTQKIYLERLRDNYFMPRLTFDYKITSNKNNRDLWDFMYDDNILEHYLDDCAQMGLECKPMKMSALNMYDRVIFEAGQGLMLDGQIPGQEVYNTPSRTGLAIVKDLLEQTFDRKRIEICYVSRTYLTRHGNGPMENETNLMGINEDDTNVTNDFQGHLREGLIDADKLADRVDKDYSLITDKTNHYSKRMYFTHADQLENKFVLNIFDKPMVSYSAKGEFNERV